MPELTSVFIGRYALMFSDHDFSDSDDDDDGFDDDDDDEDDNSDEEDEDDDDDEEDEDDDSDEEDEDDKDEDKDEDKGEDKGEKEEDIEDIEDEEDALYDQAVVMKSAKRGENERIDLPKLTSFHVEDGYTLSRAHSILFSGFAATLS